MAKSNNNIATQGLSGKIDQFVFRQRYGKTIVAKKRRPSTTITPAQQQVRLTFRGAALYAKAAIRDAALRLLYKAKARTGQTPFNMAMADFFKPPEIGEIDSTHYTGEIGSTIVIPVTDDTRVASVKVKIEKPDGSLVEQGDAIIQNGELHWVYTCTISNASPAGDLVTVTAFDLPGHSTVKQKTM